MKKFRSYKIKSHSNNLKQPNILMDPNYKSKEDFQTKTKLTNSSKNLKV
jgi:hypothetical protein